LSGRVLVVDDEVTPDDAFLLGPRAYDALA
jgi:hypothetical protein